MNPAAFAFLRAPTAALIVNSESAATIATVFGFGFCSAASAKKPFDQSVFGSGPAGMIWK